MIDINLLYSIGGVIVLLVILIFVHELGHFLVAKLSGVGVLKFSLGFGPKLFGRKYGETEYLVSAVPLGGYVKLLGESESEEVSEADEKRSFLKQTVSKRIAIVAAGPIFNLLFAVIFFWTGYMLGVPVPTAEIGEIQKASVAESSGLQAKDVIVQINDQKIADWGDVVENVSGSNGRELRVTVKRGAEEKAIRVIPQLTNATNIFGEKTRAYKMGIIQSDQFVIRSENPARALVSGVKKTWNVIELTVLSVVKMIEGVVSPKTLGGPILIAQLAGAQVKQGLVSFLFLMGLLSVNLSILNLLPIPVLDGGHLFFNVIELIIGREVNLKWREIAQQIGLFLLVILMLFVFYNDIVRIINK